MDLVTILLPVGVAFLALSGIILFNVYQRVKN